jgi:uncharacterized protein
MSNTSASSKRSPLKFFLLVFVLSLPLSVLGAFVGGKGLPMNMRVIELVGAFVPLMSALILVYREEKFGGVRRLLKRVFDYKRIKPRIWYVPIVFLMPLLMLLIYGVMRLMGLPLPAKVHIPFLTIPILFVLFLLLAIGEEVGWMGYAVDPMQDRWSALTVSLILGSIWAVWEFPSQIQMGTTPTLMAWAFLGSVGMRILLVWLYNNTEKSILAAILFHAIANTSRASFPNGGSHWDPAVGYSIVAITAVIVTFLWGSKTLARYRYAVRLPLIPRDNREGEVETELSPTHRR